MLRSIPAVLMRGGTSKGLYFKAEDLPAEPGARDRLLLAAMGSPDERQIDGVGGAHPLTSKVAVVSRSPQDGVDVDFLFLQVAVDRPMVSDSQNCGNILAGVGPFAIEQGLIEPAGDTTAVRIRMLNSGGVALVDVPTPGGQVSYEGSARIDGVPGSAAPLYIDFADVAGSSCGALLPTGNRQDRIGDTAVTCVDNGMPVVLLRAADFGLIGYESPQALEGNASLRARLEDIRLQAGVLMNLGDVRDKTVPKMSLIAAPRDGGAIATRTFIPHRVHQSIGVLGAASVAAACSLSGCVTEGLRMVKAGEAVEVEHPTGRFAVDIVLSEREGAVQVARSALLRTARKLMEGAVCVPAGDD